MSIKLKSKIIEILSNFCDKMDNVIYVMGMHYWGSREILIDVDHYCKWQPKNPRDNHAVAIYADEEFTRTVAYFRLEDSCVLYLYQLFRDQLIQGPCYINVKSARLHAKRLDRL